MVGRQRHCSDPLYYTQLPPGRLGDHELRLPPHNGSSLHAAARGIWRQRMRGSARMVGEGPPRLPVGEAFWPDRPDGSAHAWRRFHQIVQTLLPRRRPTVQGPPGRAPVLQSVLVQATCFCRCCAAPRRCCAKPGSVLEAWCASAVLSEPYPRTCLADRPRCNPIPRAALRPHQVVVSAEWASAALAPRLPRLAAASAWPGQQGTPVEPPRRNPPEAHAVW